MSCRGLEGHDPTTLGGVPADVTEAGEKDREERILDATLALLAEHGISGVSIRAVSRQAGVALGLVNYYYGDKVGLISAALRRIEEHDVALVADPGGAGGPRGSGGDPRKRLRSALRRVVGPEFLTTEYLSLRLQLWALGQAHEDFAKINAGAQQRYRSALAELIHAARPDLSPAECAQRATDVSVVQNGVWLSALLGLTNGSLKRSVKRCEEIALAP